MEPYLVTGEKYWIILLQIFSWVADQDHVVYPILNQTPGFIQWVYCANVGFSVSGVAGLNCLRKFDASYASSLVKKK